MTTDEPSVVDHSTEFDPETIRCEKRRALVAIGLTAIVGGCLVGLIPEDSFPDRVAGFLVSIAVGVYTYRWCRWDGFERQFAPGKVLTVIIVLAPPIGMVIHFMRSRGWRGLLGLLVVPLAWLGLIVVAGLAAEVISLGLELAQSVLGR